MTHSGNLSTLHHLTVVYSIRDIKEFAEEMSRIQSLFNDLSTVPWAITALSNDNEISRVVFIEQALLEERDELIPDILTHPDIGNVESLDQVIP